MDFLTWQSTHRRREDLAIFNIYVENGNLKGGSAGQIINGHIDM
jgi:hypothetical protein